MTNYIKIKNMLIRVYLEESNKARHRMQEGIIHILDKNSYLEYVTHFCKSIRKRQSENRK